MCGIGGTIHLKLGSIPDLELRLRLMNDMQAHRGPDGEGIWLHASKSIGFAHCRLSIIDLVTGTQPMSDAGNWITFNGEIYNYLELRQELGTGNFRTKSDTEVILQAYRQWGRDCVNHFRGMFAFALWDESAGILFCARDRFGIKPFYYTEQDGIFYFASEIKALIPFMKVIETDIDGFKEYLTFQFCLEGRTLFRNIRELLPGHTLTIRNGKIETVRYWEVYYNLDSSHAAPFFQEQIQELVSESVNLHLRSDVPIGAYLSGGLDSSIVSIMAFKEKPDDFIGFNGKFAEGPEFDESHYARIVADSCGFPLHEIDIRVDDFEKDIRKVIYHMDYPVAGPGSFSQYVVSRYASRHRKVVLGGQGGDEIFGGYTRYLIAYFEQCIKAAIDGTMHNGNFIVTYESIIPNLTALRNYKPLLQEFWKEGLFESMDKRYFRLINRAPYFGDAVRWKELGDYSPFETFKEIFHSENVGRYAYYDLMTHFDFKTLLPALLQVEDRVSMAHGLESRVPLLDHKLVEFAATIPANIKFKNGDMKHVFKKAFSSILPSEIVSRKDKMGFPTPLNKWMQGEAKDFVMDVFTCQKALSRNLIDNRKVVDQLAGESRYGRNVWGLLCIELWQQEFHDRASEYKELMPI